MEVPQEYYDWFKEQDFENIDKQEIQKRVSDELAAFRAMPTEEYILWQKWEEVKDTYPMWHSPLLDEVAYENADHNNLIQLLSTKLYDGSYETVEPELLWVGDKRNESIKEHWTALRILIHTQQHSGAIGRALNYLVRDRVSKKYLGVIAIASDFLDLAERDRQIGWTREQRTQEQRVRHTAVCSSVVPVQPFGYNYVGGKLLALLCLSDVVQNDWERQYGFKLTGLTTTSLYGKSKGGHGMSQYDNLKYWKKMGYSSGSSAYRLSIATKNLAYRWAKTNIPQDYYMFLIHKDEKGMTVRDRLNRFHQKIYRGLGISAKQFTSNHDRGVYFAPLYKNTNEFLRDEIKEDALISNGDFSIGALTDLWKTKYAARRSRNLYGNYKTDRLFYADLGALTWEEAKSKYLPEVGR